MSTTAIDPQTAKSGVLPAPPCTLVLFGAGGDLTKRLLMPALYNLVRGGLLDDGFRIVGVDHNERTTDEWRADLTATMRSFTTDAHAEFHPKAIDANAWDWIASRLTYVVADFEKAADYERLAGTVTGSAVFYLAVAPRFFASIPERLAAAKMLEESEGTFRRIIIEKPFGADLASAKSLNAALLRAADESQIYRIDHFLGKEPVQSIMALRFGNGMFEPMWRREHVDHVQITAAETVGVEKRASFYETTGALRDMVPNHLFQLLAMVTMDPPNSFDADDVRTEKAKLLGAVRPVSPADVVRGQYGAGAIGDTEVGAYRDEDGVSKSSTTETYAALELSIENWRWTGVPFYLRTGKRLAEHLTTISIHFKPAPYQIFRDTPVDSVTPNVLTLQIAPTQGMTTDFSVKVPGPKMKLGRVTSGFSYGDFFKEPPNVGYETLIYDCMIGDTTLFQRADHIEDGWAAVQPVLDAWAHGGDGLETYVAGSDGPRAADDLLARHGRKWLPVTPDSGVRRAAETH